MGNVGQAGKEGRDGRVDEAADAVTTRADAFASGRGASSAATASGTTASGVSTARAGAPHATPSAAAAAPAPTAQIVVEILELLDRRTDREHGMSAARIAAELGVNEKTVRRHLRTLEAMRPFGRRLGRLDRDDVAHAESADPQPGWYLEPVLDVAQMRLLTDGALLAHSDGEYLRDLIDRIHALAGRAGKTRGSSVPSTPRGYNTEFLNNIELLSDAISLGRSISFHYCAYAEDGSLVPRLLADGTPKRYHADPYDLRYKNSKYYLVCHLHQYDDLSYLHVERLRDLMVGGEDRPLTRPLDDFSDVPGEPFDMERHMDERPYPMGGPAVPIRLRVTGALEPLYDWFDRAQVTRMGPCEYDVRVMANERATLWWLLQYADAGSIEVVEPPSLRAMMRETAERIVALYR